MDGLKGCVRHGHACWPLQQWTWCTGAVLHAGVRACGAVAWRALRFYVKGITANRPAHAGPSATPCRTSAPLNPAHACPSGSSWSPGPSSCPSRYATAALRAHAEHCTTSGWCTITPRPGYATLARCRMVWESSISQTNSWTAAAALHLKLHSLRRGLTLWQLGCLLLLPWHVPTSCSVSA